MSLNLVQRTFVEAKRSEMTPKEMATALEIDTRTVSAYIKKLDKERPAVAETVPAKSTEDVAYENLLGKRNGSIVLTNEASSYFDDPENKGNKNKQQINPKVNSEHTQCIRPIK